MPIDHLPPLIPLLLLGQDLGGEGRGQGIIDAARDAGPIAPVAAILLRLLLDDGGSSIGLPLLFAAAAATSPALVLLHGVREA